MYYRSLVIAGLTSNSEAHPRPHVSLGNHLESCNQLA